MRGARTGLCLVALGAGGCVERTISISSQPSGALVYLNDQEVGRTPLTTEFLHYGSYDVRVVKEGHEPWIGPAKATPPLWDLPGPDFIAEIAPVRLQSDVAWHFELQPVSVEREAMIARALQLRARLERGGIASESAEKATPPLEPNGTAEDGTNDPAAAHTSQAPDFDAQTAEESGVPTDGGE